MIPSFVFEKVQETFRNIMQEIVFYFKTNNENVNKHQINPPQKLKEQF
jgi:hypothetical protein